MTLFIPLQSELAKSKRTSVWYVSFTADVAAPVFSFLSGSAPYSIDDLEPDPWNRFLVGTGGY